MRTGRLLVTAIFATLGLLAVAPGAAMAGGGAHGSVSPGTVEHGDDVNFDIVCAHSSDSASLTGTSLGLPSDIQLEQLTSVEFDIDLTVPSNASRGTHHISMQCSDGSSASVSLVVSPQGGANTGDGTTSTGVSSTALTVGAGLIVLAAAGGFLLLRRRGSAA